MKAVTRCLLLALLLAQLAAAVVPANSTKGPELPAGKCPEKEGEKDDSGSYLWLVGVLISIGASVCGNLGQNIQKYAQNKNPEKEYVQLPSWWMGLLLVVAGALGDVAALMLAPQSIVMPVGSFTLAANIVLANRFFGEKLSRKDLFGTFLIVLGATNVAISYGMLGEEIEEKCLKLKHLEAYYREPAVAIYGCVVCGLIFFFLNVLKKSERLLQEIKIEEEMIKHGARDLNTVDPKNSTTPAKSALNLNTGAAADLTTPVKGGDVKRFETSERYGDLTDEYKKFQRLHSTAYPAVAGMCWLVCCVGSCAPCSSPNSIHTTHLTPDT
jgi:hypothetical protein